MSNEQSSLAAPWLSEPPLSELLAALDRDGEEARVVGGAIRNTLLDEKAGDIDIATTAVPSEVIKRVEGAGFKAVPTGIEHGTITAVAQGHPFEITTLREDVETFGRRARVVFGRDWRRDAERRDFTMNALFLARNGTIYDYVNGRPDIEARRVRFIGEPAARIAEDYLRILRFFRFHASYGDGEPDPRALAACIAGRKGLEQLSRERVRMELLKLVAARRAPAALVVMTESGLLDLVLAGVPRLASFAKMAELEASLAVVPDPVRRFGALAVCVVEDADRLRERFRLSNAEYERLYAMAQDWRGISPSWNEQQARMLLYRLAPDRFVDAVLLAWARSEQDPSDTSWWALAALPARWTAPRFPLKAADFIKRGLPCGPALGAALAAAEEAWMAAGFPLEPEPVAAIADAASRQAS